MLSKRTSCEFCTEIHDPEDSLFGKLYMNAKIPSRIMKDCEHFVVMPTVGIFSSTTCLSFSSISKVCKLTDEELSGGRFTEWTQRKISIVRACCMF